MDSIIIKTPIGTMVAKADCNGVCSLDFTDENIVVSAIGTDNRHLKQLEVELKEYFDAKRREFSITLVPVGTSFQMSVWDALQKITHAETVSYAKEAEMLGRPSAVRAVANANGKNPIAILIPCHRVIASDGSIGGYSGGIWRKEFLLKLEKVSR